MGDGLFATRTVLEQLGRIRAACRDGYALAPEDAISVVGAIDGLLHDGVSIERGLGLPGDWRDRWAAIEAKRALVEVSKQSARDAADELDRELRHYLGSTFRHDRRRGVEPPGHHGTLYRILLATNGEPWGFEKLRKL